MNKKNITPNPQHPVDRVPTGKLPSALAELEEATLSSTQELNNNTLPSGFRGDALGMCSYDGEDE